MGIKRTDITKGKKAGDTVITLRAAEEMQRITKNNRMTTPKMIFDKYGLTLTNLSFRASKDVIPKKERRLRDFDHLSNGRFKVKGHEEQRQTFRLQETEIIFDEIPSDEEFVAIMKNMMGERYDSVKVIGACLRKKTGVLLLCEYGSPNKVDKGLYITKVGRKTVAEMTEEEYRKEVGDFGQYPSVCNIKEPPPDLIIECPLPDKR